MSAHVRPRTLHCLLPGCYAPRWPSQTVCPAHWHLLSAEEKRELALALFTLAHAAIVAEQEPFDDALAAAGEFLDRLAPIVRERETIGRAHEGSRTE